MVAGRYKTKPSLPFSPEAENHRRTRGLRLGGERLEAGRSGNGDPRLDHMSAEDENE
jgi:hypothetical protein